MLSSSLNLHFIITRPPGTTWCLYQIHAYRHNADKLRIALYLRNGHATYICSCIMPRATWSYFRKYLLGASTFYRVHMPLKPSNFQQIVMRHIFTTGISACVNSKTVKVMSKNTIEYLQKTLYKKSILPGF